MNRYHKILKALRSVPRAELMAAKKWADIGRLEQQAVAAVDPIAGRKFWRVANGWHEGDIGVFAERLARTK